MVELAGQVAIAIHLEAEKHGVLINGAMAVALARAAIMAMREPDEEMVRLAIIEGGGYEDPGVQEKDVRHVWQTMIDEALRD